MANTLGSEPRDELPLVRVRILPPQPHKIIFQSSVTEARRFLGPLGVGANPTSGATAK